MLDVPLGARLASRVLILDRHARVLLLEAKDGASTWWVAPGGGLEPDETFERAAVRETLEETGLEVELGAWVWTRHHVYESEGRRFDQYERFFVASAFVQRGVARRPDAYVVQSRWWRASELTQSSVDTAPRRLAMLLPELIAGRYPREPIDCGI